MFVILFSAATVLAPIKTDPVASEEASGLALVGNHLYTIDDNKPGHIFEMDMNARQTGRIIDTEGDTEAITWDGDRFIVMQETTGTALAYPGGKYVFRARGTDSNNGPEALAIAHGKYFVGYEWPPALAEFDQAGKLLVEHQLPWAMSINDLSYDQDCDCLWAISSREAKLYRMTLGGELKNSYSLAFGGGEGLVVTHDRIYVVCDGQQVMYTFLKP